MAVKKKKAMYFDDDFYKNLKKIYGNLPVGEILKNDYTKGYCYFYALLLASAFKGSELKYGALHKLDVNVNDCFYEQFNHSWVEKNGLVYDTTMKQIYLKEFYYKIFNVETERTYTHEQLQNPETFFRLGIFAASQKTEILNKLLEYDGIEKLSEEKIFSTISKISNSNLVENFQKTFKDKLKNNNIEIDEKSKNIKVIQEHRENFVV